MRGFELSQEELTFLRKAHKSEHYKRSAYKINAIILPAGESMLTKFNTDKAKPKAPITLEQLSLSYTTGLTMIAKQHFKNCFLVGAAKIAPWLPNKLTFENDSVILDQTSVRLKDNNSIH